MRATRLVLVTSALSLLLAASAQAAPIGLLKQYKIPAAASQPRYITTGADGNRWFTQNPNNFNGPALVGRITPDGTVTEFGANGELCSNCILNDIVLGPNGILYITSNDPNLIRIDSTTGTILPTVTGTPYPVGGNLAVHGNDVWITDFNFNKIHRYNVVSGLFDTPIEGIQTPTDVVVDSAGVVWWGENAVPGTLGRYDGATITTTPTPSGGVPGQLTFASDGDLWFTERFSQGVGRRDATSGAISETTLPASPGPFGITPAADGAVWFTQELKGNVARINDGGLSTYVEGKAVKGSNPFGVTTDAEGEPWYTETPDNKIAELRLR